MATSQLRPVDLKHEEVFADRYRSLLQRACQLTSGDIPVAQDLVHDAYVQFVLGRPNLGEIQSVDRYLYGILRNLYVSHLRRANRAPAISLAAVEYDSAEISLKQGQQSQFVEQLWQACEYACARKETSRAGSVIILRFFHGYYPAEIAAISHSSKAAVSESLRAAREEIVQYLQTSGVLTCIAAGRVRPLPRGEKSDADSVLVALREAVFSTNHGNCIPYDKLKRMYAARDPKQVHKTILAHVVSCSRCLETVNEILGLSPLSARDAMDMTGRDDHWSDGPGGSGAASSDFERGLERARKHAQQVFEHRPRQLIVSVNGYYLASHSVKTTQDDTELQIECVQRIEFVEILSEQGLRLAFLSADPALADQGGRITQRVELSDDRLLELTLSLGDAPASLRVVYHDPQTAEPLSAPVPAAFGVQMQALRASIGTVWQSLVARGGWGMRLVIASALLSLAAAWIMLERRMPDPAALLEKASRGEQEAAADVALHRTIHFQEESATGAVLSKRTIEVWQSGKLGRSARRVYDQNHRLIAGEWTSPDGTETILDQASEHRQPESRFDWRLDEAWRFDPSAEQFSRLVNTPINTASSLELEAQAATYVFSLRPRAASTSGDALLSAELRMDRKTLHASTAVLVVRRGGVIRSFSYEDTSAERRDLRKIDPSTFMPDRVPPPAGFRAPSQRPAAQAPARRNPALEIAVLYQLAQMNADFAEDITLAPLPDGRIRVTGVVEDRRRKDEILRALRSSQISSSIVTALETWEDEIVRNGNQTLGSNSPIFSNTPVAVEKLEATSSRAPLDPEIRRKFRDQGVSEAQLDQSVRRFSRQIVNSSLLALQHARALQKIASRFSAELLGQAPAAAKMQWLDIIIRHAEALQRENTFLDRQLRSVAMLATASGPALRENVGSQEDLQEAAQRLLDLVVSNDRTLAAAFSIPLIGSQTASAEWQSFQHPLSEALALSASILDAAKQVQDHLMDAGSQPAAER